MPFNIILANMSSREDDRAVGKNTLIPDDCDFLPSEQMYNF